MTELSDDELRRIEAVLTDLIAIERDRLLGFPGDELHKDPVSVLDDADDVLELLDREPEDVIWPEDRQAIGLERRD